MFINKKIDYKLDQINEQNLEVKELKQKADKIKQLNQSIDMILDKQILSNSTIVDCDSRMTQSKLYTDSERNVSTRLDTVINRSVALPSLNSSRLKSELSK